MATISDKELCQRISSVLTHGWYDIPEKYNGTGAPGVFLQELLGFKADSSDTPDGGRWEVKFHSDKTAQVTLFSLEAKPTGHLDYLLDNFGWPDSAGRTAFGHTIKGNNPSNRGFYIADDGEFLRLCHPDMDELMAPGWLKDELINSLVYKLRRLLSVTGRSESRRVIYEEAKFYASPRCTEFPEMILSGRVAVEFDVKRSEGRSPRNHGTALRVRPDNLAMLYRQCETVDLVDAQRRFGINQFS